MADPTKFKTYNDGSLLLISEQVAPVIGVLCTPTENGLTVSVTTGPHPDDKVATLNMLLGRDSLDALIRVAGSAWERMDTEQILNHHPHSNPN